MKKIIFVICLLLSNYTFSQTKIIAHRGAWKNTNAPQNSIESLKNSIKLGCYGSEFDVRMTQDQVLVINHDAHFEGMDIEQSTYEQLIQKTLKNGEKLPTLKEYILAGKSQKKTKLICEIKPSPAGVAHSIYIAEKTFETIKNLKAQKWIVYISFEYEILKKIKELDPNAKTQYLNGDKSALQLQKDGITGADYHWNIFKNNPNWVSDAKNLNIDTNAWTINDTLNMDYLLARKIDFITTDEPEKALKRSKTFKRTLVWSDEFNYRGLPDSTKWQYNVGGHGWGNHEAQYYTKADTNNAIVKDGFLNIIAKKQNHEESKYTSARLVTAQKQYFKYGKIEARLKLPKGTGTWPAFWMLGKNIEEIGWPACGEIDIMEQVGYAPDTLVGSLHTKAYNWPMNTQKTNRIFVNNLDDDFHVFAIDWSEKKIDFMVDNKIYLTVKNEHKTNAEWPLDQDFFIILNLAIGGDWGGKLGIDDTIFPQRFLVDYVRVYK